MISLLAWFGSNPIIRTIAIRFLVLGAVLLSIWGYGEFKERKGVDAGRAEIQVQLDSYRTAMKVADALEGQARARLAEDQKKTMVQLIAQLAEMKSSKAKVQQQIKKVVEYVTQKADAQCVVPDGAVWLLDLPSERERGSSISLSGPDNVDDPSGIALSRLVETTSTNLQECVERGTVIQAWQSWYADSQKNWDRYVTDKAGSVQMIK